MRTMARTDMLKERPSECHCTGDSALFSRDFLSSLRGLTARERQILLRLAACEGNRGIARRFGITERTVKAHLTSILTKLALTSRTEATVVALRYHGQLCPAVHGDAMDQSPIAGIGCCPR